jgi:hypothetical protein
MNDLIELQDGVISAAQAQRHLSRKAIRHRLASGRWQRPHRSVLVTHSGPIGDDAARWIAVLSIGDHALLGGVTALHAAGLRGYDSDVIHVLLPAQHRASRPPDGVIVHRTGLLPEQEVLRSGRPPRTKAARSVVDAAQWAANDDAARALVAAAFQQRLVTGTDVDEVLSRLTRARRRRLIAYTARDAAAGAHSLAEIDFGRLCRLYGLPQPSRQVVRRDSSGRRRYLDVLFQPWGVHVEVDGNQHLDPRRAWDDMRRQNELWIAGERVLRFPAWTVRHDKVVVVSQLRAALFAAGWRPSR